MSLSRFSKLEQSLSLVKKGVNQSSLPRHLLLGLGVLGLASATMWYLTHEHSALYIHPILRTYSP